jgi:hypothetical protein
LNLSPFSLFRDWQSLANSLRVDLKETKIVYITIRKLYVTDMSSKKIDGKLSCGNPVDKNNVNSIESRLIIERQTKDESRSFIPLNIYSPLGTDKESVPLVNKELNIKDDNAGLIRTTHAKQELAPNGQESSQQSGGGTKMQASRSAKKSKVLNSQLRSISSVSNCTHLPTYATPSVNIDSQLD